MSKDWSLRYSLKEGYSLQIYEYSPSTRVKLAILYGWETVDGALNHALCGSGLSEVFWRIPVGRPQWDNANDDKFLVNSIGSRAYDFSNKIFAWALDPAEKEIVSSIPLTRDEAYKMDENFVLGNEIEDED